MELLYCKQDFLLYVKEYISSQTVHSANSEPKLLHIVLLFNTFSPARLLDFQKKSTLLVYSILLDYQISVKFPPCTFIPSCSFIWYFRVGLLILDFFPGPTALLKALFIKFWKTLKKKNKRTTAMPRLLEELIKILMPYVQGPKFILFGLD